MKRIGYLLLSSVALLVIFTLALAQLEAKSAKYLLRVLSGKDVRGYYGTDVEAPYAYTGGAPLFAVSATGESDGPTRVGTVFFYDKLLADAPVLTIASPDEGDLFGWALSGGGDWNGDGVPDLAVGAPGPQVGARGPAGKVFVYLGGPDFGKAAAAVLTVGEKGDGFGEAVSLKHDINGDSLADLVVGAPRSARAGATAGRAYVWFGKASGGPAKAPDAEIRLGTTNDLFGTCLATGDVSGDGTADLLIGAPHDKIDGKWLGSVFVFHGGKGIKFTSAARILSGEGTSFQDEFGWSVAVVPDLNGDGTADIAVGAPQVNVGGKQTGKTYIYYGGAGLSSSSAASFTGEAEAGRFGQSVFSLGDLNGDGKGDWAAQAVNEATGRGVIRLYYGGWERDFYRFSGEGVGDRLGSCLAVLGDLDENGSKEIIVGARWNDAEAENAGRVYFLSAE